MFAQFISIILHCCLELCILGCLPFRLLCGSWWLLDISRYDLSCFLLNVITERNSQTVQGAILFLFVDSAQAAFEGSLFLARLRLHNDLGQLLLRLVCRRL